MMKFERIQQFLEVPSADPVQSRRAKMLNIVLLGLTFLTVVIVIINMIGAVTQAFTREEARLTGFTTLFFLASSVVIYWTNKYWSSQLAAVLFLIVVTAGLFYSDAPYETIWGRNMISLVIPVLMASLILDPRASFVLAGITGIIASLVAYSFGYPLNPIGIILYIAVALISWLTTRSLEQAIFDLKTVNVELDQRVEERTAELVLINHQLTVEVSERIQAERALEKERGLLVERVEERTAEIQLANTKLRELLKVKDEFLAKMSHELRTPLSVMLIRTEALLLEYFGALTPKQVDNLTAIDENGQHLLKLINDILDMAKIQAGQVELNYSSVNIMELCQNTLKLIEPLAKNKQINIRLDIDSTIDAIEVDEKRLKQILINLLTNAIKFTAEQEQVGLNVNHNPDQNLICFTVWDRGIGIDAADVGKLFEPFVQLDNSITRQYEGSGLGLTLVKQFTEMLGGSLSVTTAPGKGSEFTVVLPKMGQPVYHTNRQHT